MKDVDESLRILGLNADASDEEIKQAYRDLAQVWHPDRFSHNPRLREKAEGRFKEVVEAYEMLRAAERRTPEPSTGQTQDRADHSVPASAGAPTSQSSNRKPWIYTVSGVLMLVVTHSCIKGMSEQRRKARNRELLALLSSSSNTSVHEAPSARPTETFQNSLPPATQRTLSASEISQRNISSAKQLGLALLLYNRDHIGEYPGNLTKLVPEYVVDSKLLNYENPQSHTSKGWDYHTGILNRVTGEPMVLIVSPEAFNGRFVVTRGSGDLSDLTTEVLTWEECKNLDRTIVWPARR